MARRRVSQADAKRRIGRAAAGLIAPGETVFLDGGTTVECLVPHVRSMAGLTVVTFGLNVLAHLAEFPMITVIGIGGQLDHRTLTLGGALAYEFFRTQGMYFDRAFLAASGVSAAAGVTNASIDEIPLKRIAMDSARETTLLVDGSKIGREAVAQIAPIERIDGMVTDASAPMDQVKRIRELGVEVRIA